MRNICVNERILMQIKRIIGTGMVLLVFCFFLSCEKWLDPGINKDPALATEVPVSALLPAIQLDMGYTLMGTNVILYTNCWMQIISYVGRGYPSSFPYQVTSYDFDYLWQSIYAKQLINARHLTELAENEHSPYYAAVGQVLTAYVLGITTDLWGDIPYSDALREQEVFRGPAYDSQEQIYKSIFHLLDQAIGNLHMDASRNLIDLDGDVYYSGDPGAWLNAARAIKARHTLQLARRNGSASYLEALELTDAFASNADNMVCPFSGDNPNPIYQFMRERGDIRMCSTLLSEMEETDDPRIPFFYGEDVQGGISGSEPGSMNYKASLPGEYLAGPAAPVNLMTFSELKFIEAEAALQTGDNERASNAYKNAVAASLLQVTGSANTDWLNDHINIEDASTITLEKIIMQKRHALVGQLQPYSDWRRTGIPELLPVQGTEPHTIPQRYPYPAIEIQLNGKNVPQIDSLTVPVWWAE